MQLILETHVNQPVQEVISGFNQQLFEALAPPFPKVNLDRFDGCQTGDIVSMQLDFGAFKQAWVSEITRHGSSENNWFFIDEGRKLPSPLKFWRHRHLLTSLPEGGTLIIDHIIYRTANRVLDAAVYPGLLLQFLYRKPVYKKYFS